jgi:transcriptional regulator with XRE-family HTH domain
MKEVKMTKKELAERLGIDVKTLDSWEEKRPEVMRLIRIGLAAEQHTKDVEKYLTELKDNIVNQGSDS